MGKKPKTIDARTWLKQNGYTDVAEIIESFISYNKARGSGERRNYWDLLAGRMDGECFEKHGFKFPILASVRASRKPSYKPTAKAIQRNKIEKVPIPVKQARWND
jgi:hypothetical protein